MVSLSNRITVSKEIRFKIVIVGLIVLVSCLGVYIISGMQSKPNDGTWIDLSETRQQELIEEWKKQHLQRSGGWQTQDEHRREKHRLLQTSQKKQKDMDRSNAKHEDMKGWRESVHGPRMQNSEDYIEDNNVKEDIQARSDPVLRDGIRNLQTHYQDNSKKKYQDGVHVQATVPPSVKSIMTHAWVKGGRAGGPSILQQNNYVRQCITGEVIGRSLPGDHVRNITLMPQSSVEDHPTRVRSFQKIYKTAAWGAQWDSKYKGMSTSGRGSTLYWAQETINTLSLVVYALKYHLRKKRIKLLDVPCGDMQWMSRFLKTRDDIDYTGIDIVPEIIQQHRKSYKGYPWQFKVLDIAEHALDDSYDLIVSRALLQHLYFEDAVNALKHMSDSKSLYLITSTFPRTRLNRDLNLKENPGRTRHLNIELPPLSLTSPLCLQRDGPPEVGESWEHYIGLWRLPLRQKTVCQSPNEYLLRDFRTEFYSCSNVQSVF